MRVESVIRIIIIQENDYMNGTTFTVVRIMQTTLNWVNNYSNTILINEKVETDTIREKRSGSASGLRHVTCYVMFSTSCFSPNSFHIT